MSLLLAQPLPWTPTSGREIADSNGTFMVTFTKEGSTETTSGVHKLLPMATCAAALRAKVG